VKGDISRYDLATILLLLGLVTTGCAGPNGTRPQDMSASAHEAAAAAEESEARAQRADAAAYPTDETRLCNPDSVIDPGMICWTRQKSEAGGEVLSARRHEHLAHLHREAAEHLRQAEEKACQNVPDADRDESPFAHPDDIDSVVGLWSKPEGGPVLLLEGATVTFRSVPGLTAERLQKLIDCHLAHNATVGNDVARSPECPLVPKGVTARVKEVGGKLTVDIRGSTIDTAQEVLRRAKLLKPQTTSMR
jgi:hypothetical protein